MDSEILLKFIKYLPTTFRHCRVRYYAFVWTTFVETAVYTCEQAAGDVQQSFFSEETTRQIGSLRGSSISHRLTNVSVTRAHFRSNNALLAEAQTPSRQRPVCVQPPGLLQKKIRISDFFLRRPGGCT